MCVYVCVCVLVCVCVCIYFVQGRTQLCDLMEQHNIKNNKLQRG